MIETDEKKMVKMELMRLEVGGWRLEVGGWKLKVESRNLKVERIDKRFETARCGL